MVRWRVRLMGAFGLTAEGGEAVRLAPLAAQAVAWLAWRLGEPCSREALIELLWPEVAPAVGRNRLNVLLNALRNQLEPAGVQRGAVLLTDRAWVRLSAQTVGTDLAEFRAACDQAHSGGEVAQLERAVTIYDSPLLDGLYADWVAAEQDALADRFLDCARRLVSGHLSAGAPAEALRVARRAAACEPLREEARALVIRCALAQGDLAEARRQFAELERVLHESLGLSPSAELRELVAGAVAQGRHEADLPPPAARSVASGLTVHLALAGDGASDTDWLHRLAAAHGGEPREGGGVTALLEFASLSAGLRFLTDAGLSGWAWGLSVAEVDPQRQAVGAARRRAGSLAAAGHPGQVLCGEAAAALIRRDAAALATVRLLGEYELTPGGPAERVYQVALDSRPQEAFAPLKAKAAGPRGYLPLVTSRFYDRDESLAELRHLLETEPLVTVTGAGGTGKTRLVIELCRERQAAGQTVWFVDLASARDTQHVWERVLDVLGERELGAADLRERVIWLLREQPALLVLDNFEQLPPEADAVLPELVARVPGQRLLVTSRRSLDLDRPAELALPPLPVVVGEEDPAAIRACPSTALFVDRAQAVRPSFRLTERTAAAVAPVCDQLDGLPLAIEIVAPRVHLMSPASLVTSLAERFDWAAPRRVTTPERQRTLGVTVAWSRDLLPAEQQAFLDGLAIFQGPFTAAAAAAVLAAPDAAERLSELHRCSLVRCDGDHEEPVCRLLETVRQYLGRALPAERRADLAASHAAYFRQQVAAAHAAAPDLAPVLALAARLPDLRAALDWLTEHDPLDALAAVTELLPLWQWRGYALEGRERLMRLLAAVPAAPLELRARACYAAMLCSSAVVLSEADAFCVAAMPTIRAAGDPLLLMHSLWVHALLLGTAGQYERLPAVRDELFSLAEAVGPWPARLFALGADLMHRGLAKGDYGLAAPPAREALTLAEASGDPVLRTVHLTQLGICHWQHGELAAAEEVLARIPAELLHLEGWWAFRARWAIARLRLLQGRLAEAAVLTDSLVPHLTGSCAAFVGASSPLYVLLAMAGGLTAEAVTLYAALVRLTAQRGERLDPTEARVLAVALAEAKAALSPAEFAAAEAAGEALSLADLAALVRRVARQLSAG